MHLVVGYNRAPKAAICLCWTPLAVIGRSLTQGPCFPAQPFRTMGRIARAIETSHRCEVRRSTSCGQYRRALEIAWTGATTVAVLCGTIGLLVAFHPGLWMGLAGVRIDMVRTTARNIHALLVLDIGDDWTIEVDCHDEAGDPLSYSARRASSGNSSRRTALRSRCYRWQAATSS